MTGLTQREYGMGWFVSWFLTSLTYSFVFAFFGISNIDFGWIPNVRGEKMCFAFFLGRSEIFEKTVESLLAKNLKCFPNISATFKVHRSNPLWCGAC